jgi:hypothetical protein
MAFEIGVSPIPLSDVRCVNFQDATDSYSSQFFSVDHGHIGDAFVRFAFCKDVDTLKQAGERLQKLKQYI